MRYEPGDIIVVPFPYSDLKSRKQRPALILAAPVNSGRDATLCGITSNLHNAEHSVLVEQGDLAEGRLVATSRIKVTQIATFDSKLIRKRIGAVKAATMDAVRKELRALLRA